MAWLRKATDKVSDGIDNLVEGDTSGFTLSDRNALQRMFGDLSKSSVAVQVAIGGISGGCTGFVFGMFGLVGALAIIGGLLFLQFARHEQWITIGKPDPMVQKFRRQIRNVGRSTGERFMYSTELFIRENAFLVMAFAGSFLLAAAIFG